MNLVIITPKIDTITETFIKAHLEYIEANKFILHGHYPIFKDGSRLITSFFPNHNSLIKRFESILPYYITFRIKHRRRLSHSHEASFENYLKYRGTDVVLAEYGTTGADIAPICAKLGIPLVVHFHGFDAYRNDVLSQKLPAYKEMFAHAARVVVVSRDMEHQLVALGAPEEKTVYNPYGPLPEFYEVKPDYASNKIIAVGRFVEKKAPYLTLEAFRRALSFQPELQLLMVGDGPLLPVCQNLARAWGIGDKVQFTGSVPHNSILQHMAESFCFLQHSVTADNGDREGTPVAILEAGAAALPVIATRHAGISDVVIHGNTGFLVDEYDVNQMAEFVKLLASDRGKVKTVGRKARKHIFENFSIEKHIETLDRLIAQSVEKRAR